MAQGIPSWLNMDFTQRILRQSEADNSIEVIDISSKAATAKGDNYTSDMFRIFVNFSRKRGNNKVMEKKSLIIKLSPMDEGSKKDLIEKSSIFHTEMDMMTNTLKKMNELLGNKARLNAEVYHVQKDDPAFLILEDLAPLGYRMADRHSGLDLEHCLLVMRNIARFHASSAVLCERDPDQKKLYTKGMFSNLYPPEVKVFFIAGAKTLADEMENWPELGKSYADKVKAIADRIYDIGIETVKSRDDEFKVINHGDAWVNNMLFRYNDNGKPIEHIFVDFQMCIYTSPAIDLHYFLNTSPSPKVYEESKDLLLQEYLSTLTTVLKQLGYKGKVPTMDDLRKQLGEREAYGMIACFTILPVVLVEKSKVVDLNEMIGADGSYHNPSYQGEAYRKVMAKRIPYFEKLGLLNN